MTEQHDSAADSGFGNLWAEAGIDALRSLTDAIGNPVFVIGVEGAGRFRLLSVNSHHERATGLWHRQVAGRLVDECLAPAAAAAVCANYRRCVESGRRIEYEEHLPVPSGDRWWQTVLTPIFDAEGRLVRILGSGIDVTARKQAEQALRESQEQLALFFAQSLDGFFFMMLDEPLRWDDGIDKEAALDYAFHHQRLTRVNRALVEQYRVEEPVLGLTPADFFAHDPAYGRRIWRQLFDAGRLHTQTWERRADGSPMWIEGDYICLYDDAGRITGHFGIQRDITDRKRAEEERRELTAALRYRAVHDSLTGALNRGAILEVLEKELDRSAREQGRLSIGILDVDHFKSINDTYGHQAGDAVLQELVRRVQGVLRSYDSLGRYGGEEFLIVAAGGGPEVFERVRQAVAAEPYQTQAGTVVVTASIGTVRCCGCRDDAALLAQADAALYRAKRAGRDRVVAADTVFEDGMPDPV